MALKPTRMNHNPKLFILLAASFVLWLLAPQSLEAQILEKVSLSATLYQQGDTNDNNTTTTIKAPTKSSLSTGALLKLLAIDEYSEGNFETNFFPAGAKLDYNGNGFEVDDGTNELVDVSDILTLTVTGQNDINAGNYSDANGQGTPPYSETDYQIVSVAYNDSSSTGTLSFSVSGLATFVGKATNPNARTGKYTQSGTFSLQDGTGEGSLVNSAGTTIPFVMTGFTITASGSAAENNGNGSASMNNP